MSRRGFMAKMGRVVAGIGIAMVGGAALPKRAYADQCCPNPLCGSCPNGGCNNVVCIAVGSPTICCDASSVTSTYTIHQCQLCNCAVFGNCYCELDTGTPCP